jgi:hypothetical protein
MKQQENQVQKEKNVIHKLLFVIILLHSTFNFSQSKIEGKYYSVDGTGDFFNNYTFKKDIFYIESGGHLGVSEYGKGHFYIKKDSLFLNNDLSELKTNDYHKHKFYLNNKDSVKVKIIIRDTKNKPLSNIRILGDKNNIETKTNKLGIIEFSLKKKREKVELYVINNSLGYYFNIWTNRNYEIDVFLRNDNYAVPFKNQIIGYKILEITKNSIKLQKGKHTILLKKKK